MPEPPQPTAYEPVKHVIGQPFIELQSVDSTNNYARKLLADQSLPDRQDLSLHGTSIFAAEQPQGKGQRGKSWTTEKGANLILSVIVNPTPLKIAQQFMLSACVALSLRDFFSKYGGDDTKIKWPNDLYWQDRKAGGVLIENVVRSQSILPYLNEEKTADTNSSNWNWSIIGIGININQTVFPDTLLNPVSLKQITGDKNYDPVMLAKELCEILETNFNELINAGSENIYQRYLDHLYKKDQVVRLKKDNRVFEATIKNVSPSGQLIVQHTIEETFEFGTVEWLFK